MDAPLRLIVVGAGAQGRTWLALFANDPRWTLTALVDSSPAALNEAATQFDIPEARRFFNALIAFEQVRADAVLVVTPPETHRVISVAAIERGMAVLSEKPLATSLRDGVAILRATRMRGVPLMVNQGRRWLPHIAALREAVLGGLIGALGYVVCQFNIPVRYGGWRTTMPEVLIEDLAIHHFDTIRFITGRNGQRVYAHSFRPSWSWFRGNSCASVDLLLDGGLPVHYFGSWVARGPRSSWDGELRLVGEHGALVLQADDSIWHYANEDETPHPLALSPLEPEGMLCGLDHFTQAVRRAVPPAPDAEDNIHSLALTSAAVASARTGQPVQVDAHMRAAGWSPIRPMGRRTRE
ncbi:MAG: gfo/Idh/MocA family oxidoreductase [Candidatus Viridilinea halotolerans]|uniref:Gfo/Idh/MocA family oxidoreductase n=1 Tax=Candidatus Viridilinea halotolerans TaxID=2491704 RepID=A0A426U4D7_9CHLR|nr:MAG: gfo/Idh/MocA family oxidoreductase [Candidatus Viridilinea halotolerans]